MTDVNLLNDTKDLATEAKKPTVIGQPELTRPEPAAGKGFGSFFKSILNRGPKSLPVSPVPAARPQGSVMSTGRKNNGDHILTEKRRAAPSVIPLPEDEDSTFNVNLLSDDLITPANPRRRAIIMGLTALGAVLIVGLAYTGILLYQGSVQEKITTTEDQLKQVEAEIAGLTKVQKTVFDTVQKISAIQSLVDRHASWTKFFSLLEQYTLPSVTYGKSFSGDLSGSLNLVATTTSYEEVARQYLIFQQLVREKKFISSFLITGATSKIALDGNNQVTFIVSMTLLPNVFTLTAEEVESQLQTTIGTNPTIPTTSSPITPP